MKYAERKAETTVRPEFHHVEKFQTDSCHSVQMYDKSLFLQSGSSGIFWMVLNHSKDRWGNIHIS